MSEKKEEIRIQQPVEKLRVAHADNSGGAQSPASMLGGAGNLEKIKEILFGSQSREYEKRFIRLEDRMQKEITTLKEDLSKSFNSLENYMKKEFELLNERQAKEQNDRSTGDQKLMEERIALSTAGVIAVAKLSSRDDPTIIASGSTWLISSARICLSSSRCFISATSGSISPRIK